MLCDNCGKTNCDCNEYENEISELSARFVPMPFEEKMRRAEETVRRWQEKETSQQNTHVTNK